MVSRSIAAEWARPQSLVHQLLLATLGTALLALMAQVKIPLPFTPVPLTLQVLAVVLLGGFLGPRLGLLAVVEYLALGCLGLPVFSHGVGVTALWGVTGGYLMGFLGGAVLSGVIYHRFMGMNYRRRLFGALLAGVSGTLVIYLTGALWLAVWGHLGVFSSFLLGIMPFVSADILKVAMAATLLALWKRGDTSCNEVGGGSDSPRLF